MQNEIKGVLGQMSSGAAGRILDSADPRKGLTEDYVCCSEDERKHSECDKGVQVAHWK